MAFNRRQQHLFWLFMLILVIMFGQPLPLWAQHDLLQFLHIYNSTAPLTQFLAFETTPRTNVPDGQIHWVDAEVPGIDLHDPNGTLYNVCPEGGNAWSVAAGDTVGGGGQFVAVNCTGLASGWQMLAFHLCDVYVPYSPSADARAEVLVAAGQAVGKECAHTHFSLGYWADIGAKKNLPCPQWYVQGRYWVNPICLTATGSSSAVSLPAYTFQLNLENDWELRWLQPEILARLKATASSGLWLALGVLLLLNWLRWRSPAPGSTIRVHTSQWAPPWLYALGGAGFVLTVFVFSSFAIWQLNSNWAWRDNSAWRVDDAAYQRLAETMGYHDWRLLQAFYQAAVPRTATGEPATAGQVGKVFPPAAAAVIPFGETDTGDWGLIDPTEAGVYGQFRAWDAVVERWPVSLYERTILGLQISATAQAQRAGLQAIAESASMLALGRRLGKEIRAQDLYGSSAGAVGRTQMLPSYFAFDGLCGSAPSKDVWNDPQAIAECTTRHMVVNGCWGSWWATGDVWSALCGYNPGAWGVSEHQWYWDVLGDRMSRLTAASAVLQVASQSSLTPTTIATTTVQLSLTPAPAPVATQSEIVATSDPHVSLNASTSNTLVPTPVLLLLFCQIIIDGGEHAQMLPTPLAWFAKALAPTDTKNGWWQYYRFWYRFWRTWVLIYYSPTQLDQFGAQF